MIVMDSLTVWLKLISNNTDDRYAHWQIEVVISELMSEKVFIDNSLYLKIYPLLLAIKNRGKSHNHKSAIAQFALRIIEDFEAEKKANSINLDPLDPDSF